VNEDPNGVDDAANVSVEAPSFTILGSVEELALGGGSEAADAGVETAASKVEINPTGVGKTK
jgi:hypothetical protein